MSVLLGSLVLNEMEWLPRLYEQHKDWPDLSKWVFVESADEAYARTNPDMVSPDGLSVDGTSEFLKGLAAKDPRVVYVPFGVSRHSDPALCKIAARQCYMDVAAEVKPEMVVVLDGDEFYTHSDQRRINYVIRHLPQYDAFIFPKREIWRPPSIRHEPLLKHEVVGGFWGIPCCHWWRWKEGVHYGHCHNTPDDAQGKPLNDKRIHLSPDMKVAKLVPLPQMLHLGFASELKQRVAKNRYYASRGEEVDKQRSWYVKSRKMYEVWRPGLHLPNRAKVVLYTGPVPEVFSSEVSNV